MTVPNREWICCQLGAREHYSVPRGLHQEDLLRAFITDTWVPPNSPLAKLPGSFGERLRQRYDRRLENAKVFHSSTASIIHEVRGNAAKRSNVWDRIIARNDWFQAKALSHLNHVIPNGSAKAAPIVFAYSYAARHIFRSARQAGLKTILGQIDPGPKEARLVADLGLRHGVPEPSTERIPSSYWDAWHEECALSDMVLVNSPWSQNALVEEGVPPEKIRVLPLAYDPPEETLAFERSYPKAFSASRPLKVLFLGSLIPRKGVYELLAASALLRGAPVEFLFVGPGGEGLRKKAAGHPNVVWYGPVARAAVSAFYRKADVFILPTHSDGFGLTQLEAMAWGLPVIASRHCGEVVRDRENGLVLPEVSATAIAEAIEWCRSHPEALQSMSRKARTTLEAYGTGNVIGDLVASAEDIR